MFPTEASVTVLACRSSVNALLCCDLVESATDTVFVNYKVTLQMNINPPLQATLNNRPYTPQNPNLNNG